MKECHFYQTAKKCVFLAIRELADLQTVPTTTRNRLEPLRYFKTIDLETGPLSAKDYTSVLKDIEQHGFSLVHWRMERQGISIDGKNDSLARS